MPAMVESHFTVRQPAWHDLTGEYDHDENPKSIEQVLEWSGADWEPIRTPVFITERHHTCQSIDGCASLAVSEVEMRINGQNTVRYACGRHTRSAQSKGLKAKPLALKQAPDFQSVIRSDTGDILNIANSSYELFSNRETAELVEMMLESTATEGGVKFETGGVLKGGRLVWFLARLDQPIEIKGDTSPIYPYLSVLNSHDGTAALRVINTNVRIVCWNTWSAAETEAGKSGRMFSFRHTSSIRDRIDDARRVVLGAQSDAEQWAEYANRMIAIPISDSKVDMFLQDFIPMPPAATDRSAANVDEARAMVKKFYHSASCASIAGTAWGLIQATGEYLDHGRTFRTADTYVSRTMLKPEDGKRKALNLIEELVSA